jgi:RNA polymerase sigma-70 factor (ECF subfamily)
VTVSSSASDAQIVAFLAAGRQEALSLLYDRYAGLLMAVGMRVLNDRREVEDVVHDVFVEAWRQAAQYEAGRGSVRAWLVTRMRSRALDRRKSAGFSRSVPIEPGGFDWLAAPDDGQGGMDRERVRAAMAKLSQEQRQVLELAYFDGLSCSEIASRCGLPIGTVKSRSAAALSKLREGLGVPREGL